MRNFRARLTQIRTGGEEQSSPLPRPLNRNKLIDPEKVSLGGGAAANRSFASIATGSAFLGSSFRRGADAVPRVVASVPDSHVSAASIIKGSNDVAELSAGLLTVSQRGGARLR
jgi:hypothetical protein